MLGTKQRLFFGPQAPEVTAWQFDDTASNQWSQRLFCPTPTHHKATVVHPRTKHSSKSHEFSHQLSANRCIYAAINRYHMQRSTLNIKDRHSPRAHKPLLVLPSSSIRFEAHNPPAGTARHTAHPYILQLCSQRRYDGVAVCNLFLCADFAPLGFNTC